MPKGTALIAEAVYDNSFDNPAIPDPKAWVNYVMSTVFHENFLPRFYFYDDSKETDHDKELLVQGRPWAMIPTR